jgi:hypothetical protein
VFVEEKKNLLPLEAPFARVSEKCHESGACKNALCGRESIGHRKREKTQLRRGTM